MDSPDQGGIEPADKLFNGRFLLQYHCHGWPEPVQLSPNSWSLVGQTAGLGDPGSNGIVKRTAPNTTVAVPAPTGTIVGTTDAQTLTNKSIDASEINSGTLSTARMPAFTGDVATAAGSTAATLSTVNSTPGSFGISTTQCN